MRVVTQVASNAAPSVPENSGSERVIRSEGRMSMMAVNVRMMSDTWFWRGV